MALPWFVVVEWARDSIWREDGDEEFAFER